MLRIRNIIMSYDHSIPKNLINVHIQLFRQLSIATSLNVFVKYSIGH